MEYTLLTYAMLYRRARGQRRRLIDDQVLCSHALSSCLVRRPVGLTPAPCGRPLPCQDLLITQDWMDGIMQRIQTYPVFTMHRNMLRSGVTFKGTERDTDQLP